MKKYLILIMLIGKIAVSQGVHIDVTSLPTAFNSASTQSCAINCRRAGELTVHNETSERIAVGVCYGCSTTPTEDFAYIPAGTKGGRLFNTLPGQIDVLPPNSLVCVRVVDGSAVESGSWEIDCR